MKKVFLLLSLILVAAFLTAGGCFEDVENTVFASAAAFSSIPRSSLSGVTFTPGNNELVPEKITYSSSDLSCYLSDLSTMPASMSLWEYALYAVSTKSAMFEQVKRRLNDALYREGDAVMDGEVILSCIKKPEKNAVIFLTDLSSIDIEAELNLMLKKAGKTYIIKGTLNVKGDSERTLTVTSEDLYVNDTYYEVGLKYRFTKAER